MAGSNAGRTTLAIIFLFISFWISSRGVALSIIPFEFTERKTKDFYIFLRLQRFVCFYLLLGEPLLLPE